jgi:exopolyphosphatase/guanosine-5'-triphosphate,3'-diphosphate pyrophosphatase
VVATAAAREAKDGPAFVARVKAETGLTVRVLSGEEEARYAALGVLAGAPQATGVVGDLGGASLELIRLETTGAGLGVTLPLGPFSLGLTDGFDPSGAPAVRPAPGPGGQAFKTDSLPRRGRRLAQPGPAAHAAVGLSAARRPPVRDPRQRGPGRRAPGLAPVEELAGTHRGHEQEALGDPALRRRGAGKPDREPGSLKRIEISAYGVREGLLFEAMPPRVRGLDPLIEGCASLGARQGVADELGEGAERLDRLRPSRACRRCSTTVATRC